MPPRARIKLLKGTALQLAAARLYYASEKITEKVKPILERSPIKDHAYTIKARAKSPARIVRKVEEKREEAKRSGLKPSFNPENLTDGSGLRVITLFQNDIPSVIKILLELVSHDPQYAEFPFVKDGLTEVEVYTYRPDNDPYRIADAVKKMVIDAGYEDKFRATENPASGYSSVHMIFNVEVELDIDGPSGLKRVVMPMELQVRDIFEEGWAEINHKLRYKPDGTRRPEEDPFLKNWLSHLNVLKTFCDGCSQHAWIIKAQAIREPDKILADRTKPMETTQDAISLLVAVLPKHLNKKIYEIYELRARAERLRDRVARTELFKMAHAGFKELECLAKSYLSSMMPNGRPVEYLLELERAYCMFVSNEKTVVEDAIVIYQRMCENYKEDAVPLYRHARAVEWLGRMNGDLEKIRASLPLYKKATERLDTDPTIDKHHWLHVALPRQFGYANWLLAEALVDEPAKLSERLKLLRSAHDFAEAAYQIDTSDEEDRVRTVNALTYYNWQYLSLKPGGIKKKLTRKRLKTLTSELAGLVDVDTSEDIDSLETLCVAYNFLGLDKELRRVADRTLRVLHTFAMRRSGSASLNPSTVETYLLEEERDIFHSVIDILLRVTGHWPGRSTEDTG